MSLERKLHGVQLKNDALDVGTGASVFFCHAHAHFPKEHGCFTSVLNRPVSEHTKQTSKPVPELNLHPAFILSATFSAKFKGCRPVPPTPNHSLSLLPPGPE